MSKKKGNNGCDPQKNLLQIVISVSLGEEDLFYGQVSWKSLCGKIYS